MAEFNGKLGSQTTSHQDILQTLGNFPVLQTSIGGPATANVADVISIKLGDALKIDAVSSKVALYQAADTEDILYFAAEDYDSTILHASGEDAGLIDVYQVACVSKDLVYRLNAAGTAREALESIDMLKCRKVGLQIL